MKSTPASSSLRQRFLQSSGVCPPGWNSTELILTQMMKVGSLTRRFISSMISKMIFERLVRLVPPYSSVRYRGVSRMD